MRRIELDIVALSHSMTQSHNYAVVLGEKRGQRRLPIVIGSFEAQAIAVAMERMVPNRPLTHDLMQMVFQGFEISIKQVVINDLNDTVYFARIFFEQQHGEIREIVEIDSRPSDCIVLAIMSNVPLYCTREVLDKTIAIEE